MNRWPRWWIVVLFAVAMAWMEAATVYYLRTLVGRIEPYQPNPLPPHQDLGVAELIREAATLLMLATVGWLAGRTWRSRVGYLLVAFGVWDIFYYVFLRTMTGWPKTVLDWDVLFLIPLPWWGPVLAPVSIAALMIVGGTLVAQFDGPDHPVWPERKWVALNCAGIVLALYVFMADAIRVADQGEQALRSLLPTEFNWPLFTVALVLMAAALVPLTSRALAPRSERSSEADPSSTTR